MVNERWSQREVANFLADAKQYRPRLVVSAHRLDQETAWVSPAGSRLGGRSGDWLLSDGASQWTVDAQVFADTYAQVGEETYAKTVQVRARQVQHEVWLPTLEGESRAAAGDWVVCNPNGDFWPVSDDEFGRRYESSD